MCRVLCVFRVLSECVRMCVLGVECVLYRGCGMYVGISRVGVRVVGIAWVLVQTGITLGGDVDWVSSPLNYYKL